MANYAGNGSPFQPSAPVHPVKQLQGPFEESMHESAYDDADQDIFLDAVTRRNTLLEAPTYTRVVAGRWKQKPGEQYHPLWKLISQISFGVHLLAEGMARSEEDVMQILQAHVDEIDGFLERTTEDFDLAAEDISERLRCLKLPLSHPATFDKMLEDRNFRLSIVEGNEKIEHIVERTSLAMKDSMKDVQKGFDSTSCLQTYLQGLSITWRRATVEHEAVYVAMLGNVEGWRKAFLSLHIQGDKLGGSLKKLTDIINEMQARAGEVSRRLLHQAKMQLPVGGTMNGRSTPTSRFQTMPNKQLPGMPTRPPLRPTSSNATPPIRTSSQEALRRQAMLGRSQTPQYNKPTPSHLESVTNAMTEQSGPVSQLRVQSFTPSLQDNLNTSNSNKFTPKAPVMEEEQPERSFPPIELPAHVPQETMRQAPMSKQNRLSVGLGLIQNKQKERAEKRNAKPGSSTLVDLLRVKPITSKLSDIPLPKTLTSRRASTSQSKIAMDEISPMDKPAMTTPPLPRSASTTGVTSHSKLNIRRPKKGAEHWFDSLDEDLREDEAFSIPTEPESVVQTIIIKSTPKSYFEQDTEPGTPRWAATSFASAPNRREILKRGAFSSHPPDAPLASPPLTEISAISENTIALAQQRRPSHGSSAGHSTLGEPGPEIAASEVSSVSRYSGHLAVGNNNMKRASAYAPEVVVVERPSVIPPTTRQFVAEMEGSSPLPPLSPVPSSTKGFVMELEAPQSTPQPHFILPPRPPTQEPVQPSIAEETRQPYFILPPRSYTPLSSPANPEKLIHMDEPKEEVSSSSDRTDISTNVTVPVALELEEKAEPAGEVEITMMTTLNREEPHSGQVDDHIAEQPKNSDERQEFLPSSAFVPVQDTTRSTSPANDDVRGPVHEEKPQQPDEAKSLFLLPALAYKAPRAQSEALPATTYTDFDHGSSQATIRPATTSYEAPLQLPRSPINVTTPRSADATTLHFATKIPPANASPARGDLDQFTLSDNESRSEQIVKLNAAKMISITTKSKVESITREHRPAELKHTRNVASHGSHNGWKAFFTGQPSPVGSNLSIRSMRRESVEDQPAQQSPGLLTPASASSRHLFPPSPATASAKDVVWFSKPYDEQMLAGKQGSRASSQPKETLDMVIAAST